MAECRYFPECQRCNEVGDSWLPCAGGADGTRCKGYEPMPDVDALLALAEDVTEAAAMATAVDASKGAKLLADMLLDIARCIREALGVSDDNR